MNTPLVSICLPSLNTRPFLEERMQTLLDQTMPDWELIVCDSHSDDGSWDFFQKFKGDPRIRLFQVPREGCYAGWNECLRRATCEYVYIATSDDSAAPTLLENLVAPLQQRPNVSIAVCNYQEIDEASEPVNASPEEDVKRTFLGEWLTLPSIRNGKTEFLLHASMGTMWHTMTSVLFRRTLLERTGLFRTDRGSQADFEWTLRASLASDVAFVPGRLATWRWREGQGTPHGRSRDFIHRDLEMLETVLHDDRAGIPEAWKRVNDWDKHITRGWRTGYHHKFMLYRGLLKKAPGQFLRNVLTAAREEPGLLADRLRHGFAWSPECVPDGARLAKELIALFQAAWPPQEMSLS